MSPDPSGLTHADLENPQSLNLYNYVGNNPLTRVDLDGLCWKGFQWACDLGQRIDNGLHGYGFHTDTQVALHPGKAAQQKREESRAKETVGAAAFIGPIAKRLSSAQMRAIWERANPGLKVQFDVLRNRFFDMDHMIPLSEGGSNEPENLQPLEHGAHMLKHAKDWVTWGAKAVTSAEEAGQGVVNSPASQELINDVEAVQGEAGEILNTFESGGIPFP